LLVAQDRRRPGGGQTAGPGVAHPAL